MHVEILDKKIGDTHPCYITLEAGPTHDGLQTALKLVDAAANTGADAIKFQIFDPDRLVADRKLPFSYDVLLDRKTGKRETVTEPLYDILCRRSLSAAEWQQVKQRCDQYKLAFFATVSDDNMFSVVEKLDIPSYKIASADVNHLPLIRRLAKTGKCIQLDTGNATLGEIETAIDVMRAEGNHNIIVHNCPSGYPAHLESINLRLLNTIKQLFECPAAFSDHSPGWEMDIAALAMGANLLEKTITLDKTTRSVEHIMSLEPDEIAGFIKAIRDVETAMGKPRRILTQFEKDKRLAIRRSTFAIHGAKKGQRLADIAVEFRRPGFGLSPELYEQQLNMVLREDIAPGQCINPTDLIKA